MNYKDIITAIVAETKKGRNQKLAYWRIVGGLKQMFPKLSAEIDKAARAAFNEANDLITEKYDLTANTKFLEADPKIEQLLIMQTEKGGCAGCNKELQAAILEAETTDAAQAATGETTPSEVEQPEKTDAAQAATGEKRKYTKKAKNEDNQKG